MPYPIFAESAQERFQRLREAARELEAVWKRPFAEESERLTAIERASRNLEEHSRFEPSDLSPGLRDCLALEGARPPYRIKIVEDEGALRLEAEPGLDLRLAPDGEQLHVQGRLRQPGQIDYLTGVLGPGLAEESRSERGESAVVRRRDAEGNLLP